MQRTRPDLPVGLLLLGLICLCLLSAPAAVRADDNPEGDSKVEKTFNDLYPAAFRLQVNEAIERGANWLIRSQRPNGSWSFFEHDRRYPMGTTALAVLTLLKCGIPKEHPAAAKAFEYLRKLPMQRTYSVSVLLMALDAKYAPARDPFSTEKVDRYGKRIKKDPCSKLITPADLARMKEGVAFLLENQHADGYWRYPSGGYDTSNTQFALLGLHAATRCGVKVPNRVWLDALRYMLGFQEKEGTPVMYKANEVRGRYRFEWTERAIARGFRYANREGAPTGSMTTAGLTSLIICQSRLWRSRAFTAQLRTETRRGIRDAIAWLQTHFTVDTNPEAGQHWHLYYLYGLERSGILGRFRYLGTRDWYREGADLLLALQGNSGHWGDAAGWVDSCFALLFLKRATSRMNAPVITPSGSKDGEIPERRHREAPAIAEPTTPKTKTALAIAVARAIRRLDDPDPDVVFQAAGRLASLGHLRAAKPLIKTLKDHSDDDVRVAAASALGKLQSADAVDTLISRLTDADTLVRFAAEAALRRITQYRGAPALAATGTHNDRRQVQDAWRTWWRANQETVRRRLKQPRTP